MRQNFIAREYDVHIILGTNTNPKSLHKDALLPQTPAKPGVNGVAGKFYQLHLYRKQNGDDLRGGKAIKFNIFDTGIREGIFTSIQNQLADETKYTKTANGNIILKASAHGNTVSEKTGFVYEISFANGGTPLKRDYVQVFIFDNEADGDDDQVILASEIRRAKKSEVTADHNDPAQSTQIQ